MINRFLFSTQNKHRSRTIKTIFALVFSTFVMLVTISFMDHLQSNQIHIIKSVKSFPLVLTTEDENIQSEFEEYKTFKYKEEYGLLRTSSGVQSVIIRYIDDEYLADIELFNLTGLVVSPNMNIGLGEEVEITRLVRGNNLNVMPSRDNYKVSGYYFSSYAAFNSLYVFMPLEMANESLDTKLAFFDIDEEKLYNELKDEYDVLSFKEAEASLYSAFMMEKTLVFILLFSLFIIIFVQCIYNAKLFALDKERELASLYVLGMSKRALFSLGAKLGFVLSLISLTLSYFVTEGVLYLFNNINGRGIILNFPFDIYLSLCIICCLSSSLIYAIAFKSKLKILKEVVNRVWVF